MKILVALMFIVGINAGVHAQQSNTKKIEELLIAYHDVRGFNGSVLVAKQGRILYEKGHGIKTTDRNSRNSPNTIYQIASITKQFTSTLILKLVELNKLSLQDRLSKFYPGFPNGDSITIEHLLTHTSGVHDYTSDDTTFIEANEDVMLKYFAKSPLDFSPGADWRYSNSGYSLLGYIVNKACGLTYEQAMRKYVFEPLKMTSSGFDFIHLKKGEKATGFDYIGDTLRPSPRIVDSSVAFSAGAIYSTVEDLYKWHKGLQEYKIVKSALMDKAYTPVKNHYGYGWQIDSLPGTRILSHSGSINGFGSNFARVTNDDVCVAVISNKSGSTSEVITITKKILAILYNQPYSVPVKRSPVTLSEDILRKYIGTFEVTEPHLIVEITIENGQLIAQPERGPRGTMMAIGESRFYLKEDEDLEVIFETDTNGKVDRMIIKQVGITRVASKIK